MTETPAILPCPFCESDNVLAKTGIFGSLVLCRNCEARGPAINSDFELRKKELENAIEAWNNR